MYNIGQIIAWPTGTVPSGFLECNGASLLRTTYAGLFAVIGTNYGYADSTHFNLPDFRGQFLRGWAHGITTDPDKSTRTNRGDGTTGDNIGTKQTDAEQGHYHEIGFDGWACSGVFGDITRGGGAIGMVYSTPDYRTKALGMLAGSHGTPRVSTETRPTNVNVMWIIKAENKSTDLGYLEEKQVEATATLTGKISTITLNIPANSYIKGVQLRVDTAVTGCTSWYAIFQGGNTSLIAVDCNNAKNTKINSFSGGFTVNTTNIAIFKNGNDFTGGVIRAIVYYDTFVDMPDAV